MIEVKPERIGWIWGINKTELNVESEGNKSRIIPEFLAWTIDKWYREDQEQILGSVVLDIEDFSNMVMFEQRPNWNEWLISIDLWH